MDWQISEEPISFSSLAEHGRLPISFRVDRRLEVTFIDGGLGGVAFRDQEVDRPYIKDYDSIPGEGPARWAERWNLANWGLISAFLRGDRVGGVVLAFDTEGLDMLEGRQDLAVFWDIRVHPDHRRHGVGQALFLAAETWARARGCRQLKVETQNINLPACQFYHQQGCVLGTIHRFAYPNLPEEVQLSWYKDLTSVPRP
jgi:GNAT superfamily N-acetyltransferase